MSPTALVGAALALTACGGGGHGEASKSAGQIVDDVATAARNLHSFRLVGTATDAQGFLHLREEVAGPGRIHLTVERASRAYQVIAVGPETYLEGSRSYWASLSGITPTRVAAFSNRWVKFPTSTYPDIRSSLARAGNLGLAGGCWAARKKELSVAGTGSVNGHAAVILASDGSAPGSAPGSVYIATTGTPWPLRSIVTGPRKPGGTAACAGSNNVRTSDVTLSDFNRPIGVVAPPHAVDYLKFGR